MRFALIALFVLFASTASACEVGEPFPWTTEKACSPAAQKMMERVNSCLHLANEEAYDKKRRAALTKSISDQRCDALVCDYMAASKADHAMVAMYIDRHFTDENEFKGTFPPAKSCTKPVPPAKAKVKPATAAPAKPAKETKPTKSTKPTPAKTKTKPSTPPSKPEKKAK